MSLPKEYTLLFNAVEDAQNALGALGFELEKIRQALIQAQQDAEELYISREEE